ncbi:MAG: hypothetical protein LQ352_000135 [Teloschistes flavicans]|nr:MAG: hypothetical protein LQ352_000135 [Teloschistes flavicans]
MKIAIAVGEVATGSRQGWSSNRPSQLGSLGCRCGSRPERAVRRRERSSRQLRKPARARKDDGKPWDEERGEGGIYVLGKRRGAVPAHLARSGGRQTRRGRHLDPDNISYSGPTTPPSRFRNKYFEVPRDPSSVFTGRDEVRERLHACYSPSGKTKIQRQQKRFVIYGLGGSGKTQVCLKFAEDYREEWAHPIYFRSLRIIMVAEVCGLEARVSVVQRWLSNTAEPWALILDNADDPRLDISRYFPLHSTVGSYELGVMATDEAVTLLLRAAGADNISNRLIRDAAESTVHTLGYLALAITQAGAVIRQGYCKLEGYRTLYSQRRKELLSQKAIQGGEDYRYTVYTTWEVSRQMIEEMSTEAGQDALALLRIFSFLHYEGISEEIFDRVWRGLYKNRQSDWMVSHQLKMLLRQSNQEWDVYPLRAAISILRAFSLIHCDKNDLISVHPLVHSWTRDQMSVSDEDRVWRQTTATIALSVPWTFETADYRFRQSIIPHIDACLEFRERGEAGRGPEALQLTERVVEVRKRVLGEEHPSTLTSMANLASTYWNQGRWKEAEELEVQVMEIRKRVLGDEHPDTLNSINNLAFILKS